MKKLLILGCSFSSGSWVYDPKGIFSYPVVNNNDPEPIFNVYESCIGGPGWYHFVDWIKDFETTVFSFSAGGYSTWIQLLDLMEKHDQLDQFDTVMIQETSEPRIIFEKNLEHYVNNDFIDKKKNIDGINVIDLGNEIRGFAINGTYRLLEKNYSNIDSGLKKSLKYAYASHLNLLIIKLGADYIDRLCKKYNITGYVWSFRDLEYMKPVHLKRLDIKIDSMYNYLWTNGGLTCSNKTTPGMEQTWAGHQTLEGNKLIGNLLNDSIK